MHKQSPIILLPDRLSDLSISLLYFISHPSYIGLCQFLAYRESSLLLFLVVCPALRCSKVDCVSLALIANNHYE